MPTLYKIFIYLEGKKMIIGAICLAVLTFVLGRHLIATDTATLIVAILSIMGFTAAGVTSTAGYQAALGAARLGAKK